MKPAPFKYFSPTSTEEALALLGEYGGDAKALAGGQSLVPTMNFRLSQPSVLVDLNGIGELAYIRAEESGGLLLGAMTRQRAVERSSLVAERAPLVYETMPTIAHFQIRNRGTMGGSLAHADPAAELPAVMVTLDARFRLRSQGGERWLAAREFYTGLFETALAPDELLVEVDIPPLAPGTGWSFSEIARRHGDYALVGVAALVSVDEGHRCRDARLTLLSVGEGPVTADEAVGMLIGGSLEADAVREAAEAVARAIDPPGDIHATSAYRRHLARVLTRRALSQAAERARISER